MCSGESLRSCSKKETLRRKGGQSIWGFSKPGRQRSLVRRGSALLGLKEGSQEGDTFVFSAHPHSCCLDLDPVPLYRGFF